MTVRAIREFGDLVLGEPARPVTRFDAGLARLVTDLLDTCRAPGRAGLAAPQIGVSLRVFCYNIDGDEGYLVNPRLLSSDGRQDGPEGCLSIPGLYLSVPRAEQVIVAGADLAGPATQGTSASAVASERTRCPSPPTRRADRRFAGHQN